MDTMQMGRSGWIGDLFWSQRTVTPQSVSSKVAILFLVST